MCMLFLDSEHLTVLFFKNLFKLTLIILITE